MSTRVVILNGPPGCGKDTLANHLCRAYGVEMIINSFKNPLYQLVQDVYNMNKYDFMELATNRSTKDVSNPKLGGRSPREALIHMSEEVIKPNFGNDYFGKQAAKWLARGKVNVFPDGGFVDEMYPIVDSVGASNLFILKIFGRGDFTGDSRSYIPHIPCVAGGFVINNSAEVSFLNRGLEEVSGWLRDTRERI